MIFFSRPAAIFYALASHLSTRAGPDPRLFFSRPAFPPEPRQGRQADPSHAKLSQGEQSRAKLSRDKRRQGEATQGGTERSRAQPSWARPGRADPSRPRAERSPPKPHLPLQCAHKHLKIGGIREGPPKSRDFVECTAIFGPGWHTRAFFFFASGPAGVMHKLSYN